MALIGAVCCLTALAHAAGNSDEAARHALDLRLQRLEAIKAVERLQDIFGYYQDRFLYAQSVALFASADAEVHDEDGVWSGADAPNRWKAYLMAHHGDAEGPVAGVMLDRPQLQGVIDIAPDGRSASARFRTLGRSALYATSEDWIGGVYENDYALEKGVWKIRVLRYCTTWSAPYQSGRLQTLASRIQWAPGSPGAPDRLAPDACSGDELSRHLAARFVP